jgi:hypothetical protein
MLQGMGALAVWSEQAQTRFRVTRFPERCRRQSHLPTAHQSSSIVGREASIEGLRVESAGQCLRTRRAVLAGLGGELHPDHFVRPGMDRSRGRGPHPPRRGLVEPEVGSELAASPGRGRSRLTPVQAASRSSWVGGAPSPGAAPRPRPPSGTGGRRRPSWTFRPGPGSAGGGCRARLPSGPPR